MNIRDMLKVRQLTRSDVTFELIVGEENEHPDLHFGDKQTVDWIVRQLNQGNQWAWFCAEVRATWNGFSQSTYLGACSYRNEREFREDQWDQMVDEALDALNRSLATGLERVRPLLETIDPTDVVYDGADGAEWELYPKMVDTAGYCIPAGRYVIVTAQSSGDGDLTIADPKGRTYQIGDHEFRSGVLTGAMVLRKPSKPVKQRARRKVASNV
jgi:hypothetical protein